METNSVAEFRTLRCSAQQCNVFYTKSYYSKFLAPIGTFVSGCFTAICSRTRVRVVAFVKSLCFPDFFRCNDQIAMRKKSSPKVNICKGQQGTLDGESITVSQNNDDQEERKEDVTAGGSAPGLSVHRIISPDNENIDSLSDEMILQGILEDDSLPPCPPPGGPKENDDRDTQKNGCTSSGSVNTSKNERRKRKYDDASDLDANEKMVDDSKNCKTKQSRPCSVCGEFQTNLIKHLKTVHRDHPDVKKIFMLPIKERSIEFDRLRKRGILKHNMKMIHENRPLMLQRNRSKGPLKICFTCHAFITPRYFYRHRKICTRIIGGSKKTASLCLKVLNSSDSNSVFENLLRSLKLDETGRLCREDDLIKVFGRSLYEKYQRHQNWNWINERRKILHNMQTLAGVFLEFKQLIQQDSFNKIVTENIFEVRNLAYLKKAMKKRAIVNGNVDKGLKEEIISILKSAASVLKGIFLLQQEERKLKVLEKFELEFLNKIIQNRSGNNQESHDISSMQLCSVQSSDQEDFKKIEEYTLNGLQRLTNDYTNWDLNKFSLLRDMVISRLAIFNAWRGGDPSSLTVCDWQNTKSHNHLSSTDNASGFTVVYHGSHLDGHLIPILVPPDCSAGLDFLSNFEVRKMCYVHERNAFLFPTADNSISQVSGWESTRKIAISAGVRPDISCKDIQRISGTISTGMSSPLQPQTFLQPTENSTEQQLEPAALPTLNGNFTQNELTEENVTQEISVDSSELTQEYVEVMNDLTQSSDSNSNKKSSGRTYTKWNNSDTACVRNYFKEAIEDYADSSYKGSLPGKAEILKFLLEHSEILENVESMEEKLDKIHTKLFNERNKFRRMKQKMNDGSQMSQG